MAVSKEIIGQIQSTFYTCQQLEFPWKTPKNGFGGYDHTKTESDKKKLVRMRRNKNFKKSTPHNALPEIFREQTETYHANYHCTFIYLNLA